MASVKEVKAFCLSRVPDQPPAMDAGTGVGIVSRIIIDEGETFKEGTALVGLHPFPGKVTEVETEFYLPPLLEGGKRRVSRIKITREKGRQVRSISEDPDLREIIDEQYSTDDEAKGKKVLLSRVKRYFDSRNGRRISLEETKFDPRTGKPTASLNENFTRELNGTVALIKIYDSQTGKLASEREITRSLENGRLMSTTYRNYEPKNGSLVYENTKRYDNETGRLTFQRIVALDNKIHREEEFQSDPITGKQISSTILERERGTGLFLFRGIIEFDPQTGKIKSTSFTKFNIDNKGGFMEFKALVDPHNGALMNVEKTVYDHRTKKIVSRTLRKGVQIVRPKPDVSEGYDPPTRERISRRIVFPS